MSAHEFTIVVTDLDAGGKSFHFPVRSGWLRGALEGHEATSSGADGGLDVRVSKSGHDVVVRGAVDAELSLPCARCLELFKLPLHADLSVLYVPAGKAHAEDETETPAYEFTSEEADTLPYDGETVVLDDLVRDELLLEIPMIPLCSEACPGISPAPGEEHERGGGRVDPRLLPLMQFRGKAPKT
jgi:DUF177 domain-containing protein